MYNSKKKKKKKKGKKKKKTIKKKKKKKKRNKKQEDNNIQNTKFVDSVRFLCRHDQVWLIIFQKDYTKVNAKIVIRVLCIKHANI